MGSFVLEALTQEITCPYEGHLKPIVLVRIVTVYRHEHETSAKFSHNEKCGKQ